MHMCTAEEVDNFAGLVMQLPSFAAIATNRPNTFQTRYISTMSIMVSKDFLTTRHHGLSLYMYCNALPLLLITNSKGPL